MPILQWLTRDEDVKAAQKVPYRLLEEVSELSYGNKDTGNMLVQGNNLYALKALLPFYAGQVKCVYIDPPYNTKSAFKQYDDNLEHTQWLQMMWPRLEILRDLLCEDGSIWISINDNEAHYLKVIGDEIFGRNNFVSDVIWQKRYSSSNDAKGVSENHDHILVWAKDSDNWKPNRLLRDPKSNKSYKNSDNDPRGLWRADNYKCNKSAEERPNLYYPIINPNTGEELWPLKTAVWRYNPETHKTHVKENRIWWGKDGKNKVPAFKRFLVDTDKGQVPSSIWLWEEVGHTQDGKREQQAMFPNDPFATPKPEKLMDRIVSIATSSEDIVLDSFVGSASTLAVAAKKGRKYIGIEMGEHAVTHCQPRLRKVVDGEQGGISKSVNWSGGGGFRFYRLGDDAFDENGQICADIRFPVLAAHIWFSETNTPWNGAGDSPAIGIHDEKAYALLYNGILGDKRPDGGNVLTSKTLQIIRDELAKIDEDFTGPLVIYGESSRIGGARLKSEGITFKQIPYDVKAR